MAGEHKLSQSLIAIVLAVAAVQACQRVSRVVKPWTGGFQGEFNIGVSQGISTWSARIAFEHPVSKLDIWSAESRRENDNTYILTPKDYNGNVGSGGNLYLGFVVHYRDSSTGTNPCLTFYPGQSQPGSGGSGNNNPGDNKPAVTVKPSGPAQGGDGQSDAGAVKTPGSKYDYDDALYKGLKFYEAQRSGKLPSDNLIPWRGDSEMNDGKDVGKDLTGGWHDAGDHIKFGLPMAYSATTLLYGMEFFKQGYQYAGQLGMGKRQVKWALDYFLKCHVSKDRLYVQVAEPDDDHSWWGRPEDNHQHRPSYWIGAGKATGGADVAGETAAALAAGSVVFKDDPTYSSQLLTNAKSIYNLGKANPGTYNNIVPKVQKFYGSTSWKDNMGQAAAWIAYAIGKNDPSYNSYLNDAKNYVAQSGGVPWAQSWDDGRPTLLYLMYKLTGDSQYSNALEAFLASYRPGGNVPRNKYGMVLRDAWGSTRYAANAAFVALLAAKAGVNKRANHDFATKQINLILGDAGRSYVVGFGHNYPKRPHHKAASCPWKPAPCGWDNLKTQNPNPHVVEGALVGGPGNADGWFDDNREKYEFTEVATDYNAGFCGALAGIKYYLVNPI